MVEVPLDRWIYTSSLQKPFTNYLSFGVDAAIAHRFHHIRLHYPFLCKHPFINVLLYAWCIMMELLFPTLHSLSRLRVTADNKEIPVAGFHSVLFLNIPYFCGGGLPLGRTVDTLQSCDQQIEIIGFYSVFHLLAMKFGLRSGTYLLKAKHVEWRLKEQCPVQADGESWIEETLHGEINYLSSLDVLVPFEG